MPATPSSSQTGGNFAYGAGMLSGQNLTIYTRQYDVFLICTQGETAPQIVDGYGGWAVVDRNADTGVTEYAGVSPIKQDVSVLLDGFSTNMPVGQALEAMQDLAQTTKHHEDTPPVFRVSGNIHHRNLWWVMENLEHGPSIFDWRSGALIRQALVMHLVEYISPEDIRFKKKKKRKGKGRKTRFTVSRNVNTCLKISQHVYNHDAREIAKKIARLNDIRGINTELKVGRVVRLPKE